VTTPLTHRANALAWAVATAAAYALLARVVLAFYSTNGMVSVFWPGAGVALAALLLGGWRFAAAVFLGAFVGEIWTGRTVGPAVLVALGALLEAALGTWLLRRKGGFDISLRTPRDFFRFCVRAGALSPAVGASVGVATLTLTGSIAPADARAELVHWWMGDALGIVVVTPLILVWRRLPDVAWPPGEAAILFGFAFMTGQILFLDWLNNVFGLVNRGYWMYLVVSWAAVRFGLHGVLLVLLVATIQALLGAALGTGFFGNDLAMTQLTNFWAYTMILATVGMSVAIAFSERRRAADELRKLSLAVSQSPVSIVITDPDARIEYVNPAFTRASGYAAAEVLGRNPRVLQSGRTPRPTYEDLWTTLTAGRVWHGEFINRRKDGTEYQESATISPVRQEDGRVTHYVGVKADITELKRAMTELRVSEERLRLAKTAAGMGIFDRDIASGMLAWDERVRELWGVAPQEPVDYATFLAGVHPDDRAATQAAVERSLDPAGDGEYRAEYRVVSRVDGSVRHVAANGRVLFEEGRPARLIGTIQDVTERKRLEKEVQERRSQMELLVNQQVAAQTAAAIAHELNQPLVSISAYSEAALRMLRSGNQKPDKLARALEGAMEQAQRAGRTLHELLDFLHTGEAEPETVDLNGVVRESLAIAEESGYGGFHPVVELEPGLPPVQANRLQVQKVLVNLLNNGVDAMRGAGVPTAAITIKVRTAASGDVAQVTVRDSGPGLDTETSHRVFEPFFTTKPGGIGLGLAISRALIEANGGQLWVDPAVRPGATFHFTLPFVR